VGGADGLAAAVAAEMSPLAAVRAAVPPGQHDVVDQQAVERRGKDFQRRALVAEVNPDRHSQDEAHGRTLEDSLHQPGRQVVREIDAGGGKRLEGKLVPGYGEVVF